jgi:hypothetical protein
MGEVGAKPAPRDSSCGTAAYAEKQSGVLLLGPRNFHDQRFHHRVAVSIFPSSRCPGAKAHAIEAPKCSPPRLAGHSEIQGRKNEDESLEVR